MCWRLKSYGIRHHVLHQCLASLVKCVSNVETLWPAMYRLPWRRHVNCHILQEKLMNSPSTKKAARHTRWSEWWMYFCPMHNGTDSSHWSFSCRKQDRRQNVFPTNLGCKQHTQLVVWQIMFRVWRGAGLEGGIGVRLTFARVHA